MTARLQTCQHTRVWGVKFHEATGKGRSPPAGERERQTDHFRGEEADGFEDKFCPRLRFVQRLS